MSRDMEKSSHIPTLIKIIQITDGTVLEFGSGPFSTPLLHWLCFSSNRKLITFENNQHYYIFSERFRSKNHEIILVDDWGKINLDDHYAVAFIDHSPQKPRTRGTDIIRLKNKADYIVVHDTGPTIEKKYGYEEAWPHFKYKYDWKEAETWTTVVSNFRDLSNL